MRPVVETRIIRVDPLQYDPALLDPAWRRSATAMGMPTDTVYGVRQLDRPTRGPLREFRGGPEKRRIRSTWATGTLAKVVPGPVPASAQRLIQKFWPDP